MRSFPLPLALGLASLLLPGSVATADGNGRHLVVQQWVAANAEGRLDAVIVAPGGQVDTLQEGSVKVALVSQDGAIYRAQPAAESSVQFSFAGVPAGVYTLVARGPNLVACYAVHVLESIGNEFDVRYHRMEIGAAGLRVNKVRNAVIRYMPSSIPFVAGVQGGDGPKLMTELDAAHTFRVAQTAGGMSGRIYRAGSETAQLAAAAETNVLLYQNRELIGQAISADDGTFSFDALAPGFYSVIAIGPDGIGVVGFQLVEEVLASRGNASAADGGQLVALQQSTFQPQFELQLAPSGLESPAIDELIQDEATQPETLPPGEAGLPVEPASMQGPPGGGVTGGGGGGGAGGGGGGRGSLAPVLGFAAAGAAFAAASSDDDDSFPTPPVTSPITP